MINTPTVVDVGNLLVSFLEKTQNFNHRLCEVEDKVNGFDERVLSVEENVASMKTDYDDKINSLQAAMKIMTTTVTASSLKIGNAKPKIRQNEISVHAMEQYRVDNHVYLSGFASEPHAKSITTTPCNKFEVPLDQIEDALHLRHQSFKKPLSAKD